MCERRLGRWDGGRLGIPLACERLRRLGPDGTRLIPWTGNGAQGSPRDRHGLGMLTEPYPQFGPRDKLIDDDHI